MAMFDLRVGMRSRTHLGSLYRRIQAADRVRERFLQPVGFRLTGNITELYASISVVSRWRLLVQHEVKSISSLEGLMTRRVAKWAGHITAGRKVDLPTGAKNFFTYPQLLAPLHTALARRYRRAAPHFNAGAALPRVDARRVYEALVHAHAQMQGNRAQVPPSYFIDDQTGCVMPGTEGHWVRTGVYSVAWRVSDADSYGFVNEHGGSVFVASMPDGVYLGERDRLSSPNVVAEYATRDYLESNDYHLRDRDNVYIHPDRWAALHGMRSSDYDDDDFDSDDYDSDSGLFSYHSDASKREDSVRRHPSHPDDPLKNDSLTLGFEAEIEVPSRRSVVDEIKGDALLDPICILESDGSLSSTRGFEMVTGWSTLHTVTAWGRRYCEILTPHPYDTHGCGLHIAVGGLDRPWVARINGFVFDRDNRPLLRDIAGRDYNNYAKDYQFQSVRGNYMFPEAKAFNARKVTANMRSVFKRSNYTERYQALNYRTGDFSGTLEWRMFAATGNAERMVARLQFVWALCRYLEPILCNPMTMDGFLRALVSDTHLRRNTKELREYLVRTPEHEARHPAFTSEVRMLKTKAEKKTKHLAEKSAVTA